MPSGSTRTAYSIVPHQEGSAFRAAGLTERRVAQEAIARRRSLVEAVFDLTESGLASLFGFGGSAERLDRQHFWSAMLVSIGFIATAYAMDWFLFGSVLPAESNVFPVIAAGALVLRLPFLGVRRLRDTGRNGWMMLILLVPIGGWLLLVRWWCAPSASDGAVAKEARASNGRWNRRSDAAD